MESLQRLIESGNVGIQNKTPTKMSALGTRVQNDTLVRLAITVYWLFHPRYIFLLLTPHVMTVIRTYYFKLIEKLNATHLV